VVSQLKVGVALCGNQSPLCPSPNEKKKKGNSLVALLTLPIGKIAEKSSL